MRFLLQKQKVVGLNEQGLQYVNEDKYVKQDNNGNIRDNDVVAWKTNMMQVRHQISSAVMP